MSLRLRFLLSLLAVLAVVALPALYAVNRVSTLRDIVLELRGQAAQSALAVRRLDAALVDVDRYQRVYAALAATDPEVGGLMHGAATDISLAVESLRQAGFGDLVANTPIRPADFEESVDTVEVLVAQGLRDEATDYLLEVAKPRIDAALAAVPVLAEAIDVRTGASVPVAQQSAVTAATATTAAVLAGVVLAVLLALASARVLTSPLDRLRRAMAAVAEGSLDAPSDLPYERKDKIGDLSRSFRTMTLRLAEFDRLKAEFVGAISHDLKAPVSVISGYTELLQEELDGRLDPRQNDLLRSLSEQTRTVQRRIDQLLEVSRVESGRLRLQFEQIDIRHFAAELHRQYEPAARVRGIMLDVHVSDSSPEFMMADPDVLRVDVIGNLVDNALRVTPAGGSINISMRADGERIVVEVADSGPGIPEDRLGHIFERYYQSRDGAGGAGLGLTLARAGVENHGGRIEAHSRTGRGARFRFTLPARTEA